MRQTLKIFRVEDLPAKEILRGVHLRSVHLPSLMMTFVDYAQGSAVPNHFHPSEQITYVLDGVLEVDVDGVRHVLRAGDGIQIPPNVEHGSRPLEGPAKALDAWTPVPDHFKVDPVSALADSAPVEGEIVD